MSDYSMKTCTKCKRELPATTEYFRPHKAYASGLRPHCIECMREYDRQYLERKKDVINPQRKARNDARPEIIAAREQRAIDKANQTPLIQRRRIARKKWELANPEKVRQARREWKRRNPDPKASQRAKRWEQNNPEKRKEVERRYRTNHPEVLVGITARRRARKLALPNTLTKEEIRRAYDYFNNLCAICGNQLRDLFGEIRPHLDHWIALSDKRPDNPGTVAGNMLPMCSTCNQSKHDKDSVDWLVSRYGKRKTQLILDRVSAYFEWVKGRG